MRVSAWMAAVAVVALIPAAASAQRQTDREAVRQAAADYVDGIYKVQPERIERSVHPSLVKRGFHKKDALRTSRCR